MMKRQATVGIAALGLSMLSLVGIQTTAFAQQASFPVRTKNYRVPLVRAFDACTAPTLTVTGANLPSGGCVASNTATDDSVSMRKGKVLVKPTGKISLSGAGFTVGDALRVRLKLRVTQKMVDTNMGSNQTVTFSDVTVDCPPAPDAFTVRLNGSVHKTIELGSCLSPTFNLARGDIEVLAASVVNVDTSKAVGVPGVVIRP